MNDFGFIIPSYCSSEIHLFQLKRCLLSINNFHPDSKIIVIDDFSDINLFEELKIFKNVKVILSPIKSAGDMVTYKIFKENNLFKKAVIIQDSMILEKYLDNIDKIDTLNYIWYFTNHRCHWHIIEEPQNDYNIKNNIKYHDDAVIDAIKNFIQVESFKNYALDIYHKKDRWSGCFGCLTVIDYDFLENFDKKTGIIDILSNFNNNRLRRVAESIFAIACMYVLGEEVFEKAYDGLYYDGIKQQNGYGNIQSILLGFPSNILLTQVCKNEYFSKISFDRRS